MSNKTRGDSEGIARAFSECKLDDAREEAVSLDFLASAPTC